MIIGGRKFWTGLARGTAKGIEQAPISEAIIRGMMQGEERAQEAAEKTRQEELSKILAPILFGKKKPTVEQVAGLPPELQLKMKKTMEEKEREEPSQFVYEWLGQKLKKDPTEIQSQIGKMSPEQGKFVRSIISAIGAETRAKAQRGYRLQDLENSLRQQAIAEAHRKAEAQAKGKYAKGEAARVRQSAFAEALPKELKLRFPHYTDEQIEETVRLQTKEPSIQIGEQLREKGWNREQFITYLTTRLGKTSTEAADLADKAGF